MRLNPLALLALLAACAVTPVAPPVSSTAPAHVQSLRIATWNLEHLAERDGEGCRPRTNPDYEAMRAYLQAINPDVVAFQEVENEAAARRVFEQSAYDVFIEYRQGSGRETPCSGRESAHMRRQATGFAVRRGLNVLRHPDLTALQARGLDLRSGVDITVARPGGAPLRLLSVHLKSGCFQGASSRDCPRLFEQVPIVEGWIDARVQEDVRFGVLGDFNRRLSRPGDVVWADWDDNVPDGADITLAAGERAARCDPRYTDFIDHIILDRRAAHNAHRFQEWEFPQAPLSDHCAISIDLEH